MTKGPFFIIKYENNIAISFMKNDFLVANESLFYEIYENNFAIFLTGF